MEKIATSLIETCAYVQDSVKSSGMSKKRCEGGGTSRTWVRWSGFLLMKLLNFV